jgi:hypothetical protein
MFIVSRFTLNKKADELIFIGFFIELFSFQKLFYNREFTISNNVFAIAINNSVNIHSTI